MVSKVPGATLVGLDAFPVEVEVDIARGLPALKIVGLPEKSVQEAKVRVGSAIENSQLFFPPQKVTVNLAPADLPKEGPLLDLPIALGVLAASSQIPQETVKDSLFAAELGLDGKLHGVRGMISVAMLARKKKQTLFFSKENAEEVAWVKGASSYAFESLHDLFLFLKRELPASPISPRESLEAPAADYSVDFAEIRGQNFAKRAIEIAAAGGHNVLMVGPPGSGKTMLAERLPTILPPMTLEECLEVTRIYSVSGHLSGRSLLKVRPVRSPHHTISSVALIGGGAKPTPGEVSLAHRGVLFLDELPEFRRDALEVLRQPMEKGEVSISRARGKLDFPASFMLIAAMNPCPCGFYGDSVKECSCTPPQIRHYSQKISGPLLDRIDIHLEVPRLHVDQMLREEDAEPSAAVRERVTKARATQRKRYRSAHKINAHLNKKELRAFCPLHPESKRTLSQAIEKMGYSARAYDRIVKLARTIADLEESEEIQLPHLMEALQYRSMDRGPWAL